VIRLRKHTILAVLTVALFFAMSSVAYANFGPHGGYSDDTDSCAACHRAHTSFSPIQRTEYLDGIPTGNAVGSALLVSSSQNMREFCTVCHGNDAPGASTNVIAGVFDSGPSAPDGILANPGAGVLYETNSTFGGTLNAGGFRYLGGNDPVTSMHSMSPESGSTILTGTTAPLWGFGSSASTSRQYLSEFSCTSCHDPHGSTNYRLLKDSLPGGAVGGFNAAGQPDPFVISSEEGFPQLGWQRGEAGALQMAAYRPNYTAPQYRNTGLQGENISGWCAGCHQRYDESGTAWNYQGYLGDGGTAGAFTNQVGAQAFHRHPVNRPVANFPNSSLSREPVMDGLIPLERTMADPAQTTTQSTWGYGDMIGCLTCHRAHGTSATMSGWAESSLVHTSAAGATTWTVEITPGSGGVNPNQSSSLLRADNRGVCQRCHNM